MLYIVNVQKSMMKLTTKVSCLIIFYLTINSEVVAQIYQARAIASFGQSNIAWNNCRNSEAGLPMALKDDIYIVDNDQVPFTLNNFQIPANNAHPAVVVPDGVNWVDMFVHDYQQEFNTPLYICNWALGGTSIAINEDEQDWNPSSLELLKDAIDRMRFMRSNLNQTYGLGNWKLDFILWEQWESDKIDGYAELLQSVVDVFAENFPGTPFIIVGANENILSGEEKFEEQRIVVNNNMNVFMFPTTIATGQAINFEIGSDGVHYTCNGSLQKANHFLPYVFKNLIDDDGDGSLKDNDCDDNDNTVFPGAEEVCNYRDDDCNGEIDDGLLVTRYFYDADMDGYGDAEKFLDLCFELPPPSYVTIDGDCDDGNPSINPEGEEFCNFMDEDCDGEIDEGLELFTYYRDFDGDGFGINQDSIISCQPFVPSGFSEFKNDCNDADNNIYPGSDEVCNDIDDNCDGVVDEGFTIFTFYEDVDGDGFGDQNAALETCLNSVPIGFSGNDDDCDDGNADIYPGATEILANGLDENCDGEDLVTATHDFEKANVSLTPNPASNYLQVKILGDISLSMIILDEYGREVYSKDTLGLIEEIDISHFKSGVYFVEILNQSKEAKLVEKIIKVN